MYEFKIDGPALKKGIPLHITVSALDNFQSIIDKTFLVYNNSKKLSPQNRDKFQLKAQSFTRGSFITHFEIILADAQLMLPLIAALCPQNIWDYAKSAFNLLKLVCGGIQNGQKPSYQYNNNGDVNVTIGNTKNNFYGQVIQIGQSVLTDYQGLTSLIKSGKLDHISAGYKNCKEPDISLGKNDINTFDIPTKIQKEHIEIDCEIFDFNKYREIIYKGQKSSYSNWKI
ncbi:MAG: fructose 1,6-bisphosphatase [Deltaproteobacteria bacterium]|nr:fructose 1,6-bisphosphatase [Deltaproteobacteria bacterium]